MANISSILRKIREAIYGQEVRGSLADGLEAVNNETIAATNLSKTTKERQDLLDSKFDEQIKNMTLQDPSSAEIVDMRTNNNGVTYETAGKRVAELESQLEDKANLQSVDFLSGVGRGNKSYKGMLTFVTDDARIQDWTIYKDIFANNNIGCSTAVVTNKVGTDDTTWLNLEQLKTLQNQYGWEMVSHAKHGNFPTLTDEELDRELKESREWLIENGFTGYDFLMLPYGFGHSDLRVRKYVSKHYKAMRNSESGFNRYPISSYDLRLRWITNSTTVDAITGFATNTIEHWKALIDRAISEKYWFIIGSHSWEIENWGLQTLLSQIVAYANEKRQEIDIVSFREGYEKQGNVIEQITNNTTADAYNIYDDGFVIDVNGNVKTNIGKTKLLAPNTILFNTLPADIPKGCVSICNITSANASSFPEGKAGMLITYCFSPNYDEPTNRYYYWQEYHVYGSNRTYSRGAKTSTAWYSFTYQDFQIASGLNGLSTLQDFPDVGVFITPITDANAGGLPITTGGTLITYRPSSYSYAYQTFKKSQSDYEWTRYAKSLTIWSEWTKISPVKRNNTKAERDHANYIKELGDEVFDTTLGKPIWYNGTNWVDAAGNVV